MLTSREASQRNALNRVRMSRSNGEYRVTLQEWPNGTRDTEDKAYYTDDIEDAVLTGGMMRRQAEARYGSVGL